MNAAEFVLLANSERRRDRRKARKYAEERAAAALTDAERDAWTTRVQALRSGLRVKITTVETDILAGDILDLDRQFD